MRKIILSLKNSLLLVLTLVVSTYAYAADLYWIGGSGNWNDGGNWSMTSGGSAAGIIPTSADNVFFDSNSFTEDFQEVYLASSVEVSGFEISSAYRPAFEGGLVNLTIKEDFILSSKAHFSLEGKLIFNGAGSFHTIESDNTDFFTTIEILGGNWELTNSLKTDPNHDIILTGGHLKSNENTIYARNILANLGSIELEIEGSVVYAQENLDLSTAVKIGGDAMFASSDITIVDKGEYPSSEFKDATVACTDAAPLVLDLTITSDYNGKDISCKDSCDGELTISMSGSPGPFAISFDGGAFGSATVFPNLCVGTYTVTVRDSSNEIIPGSGLYAVCSIDDNLVEPSKVGLDFIGFVDPSCPDICDGVAVTSPKGGTSPYTFLWDSGNTTSTPNDLCVGGNDVTVTDINGCFFDTTFVILGPPPFTAPAVITPPSCNGDCDAEIDVTPGGANGAPYGFTWSPAPTSGASSEPGIGFCAGSIDLTLTDVDGCTYDTTYVIVDPPVLTISIINIVDASCFGFCDGEAEASLTGGVPGYNVEWFDDATGLTTGVTGTTIDVLCAGDYFAIVTDASGCSVQSLPFTIGEPTQLLASATGSTVSCPGVCDGTADGTVSGGTLPYVFTWETFPGGVGVGATEDLTGLCPGQYEFTVEDDNGCIVGPILIDILEPAPLTLTITGTNPSCYDLCDGSAVAVAGGGTPPYAYAWVPLPGTGGTTDTPTDMCAGTYDLTVTDAGSCVITDNITLDNPPLFDISSTVTPIQCFGGADGAIDIIVNSGGSGVGYTYVWTPAAPIGDGTPNVSGLTAGGWSVTIADDQGCDTTLNFTITSPPVLNVSAGVIAQVSCNGDCDGSANVTISGGTSPYSILWDDPAGQTSTVASGLCAGTYIVTVTDDNGCVQTDNVDIVQPAAYDITTTQTALDCFGDCDATATVTVNSGGTPAYTYLWDDPLTQTTPTAIGLCAGVYTCTVTDANLCDSILTFTIVDPPEMIVTITGSNSSCFGTCTGTADISIVGGTPPYSIEWFDVATLTPQGVDNDTITGLCPGDYFAVVTDANGCSVQTADITINELPEIFLTLDGFTDEICGACDGTADVSATGGAGGFVFDWTPDPAAGDGTGNVTGLCAGVYNVIVTDAAGCTDNISVNISSIALEVLDLDSTDVSCFGVCDGTATANFVALDPPYTIEWFDATTGLTTGIFGSPATGLCAGDYTAVLTNSSGCVTSETITINDAPEITGTITEVPVDCAGDCDGQVSIVAAGGTGTLTYFWSPLPGGGQGTPNAIGLCAGNWTVTVTDDNGCSEDFIGTVAEPTALVIDSETHNDISCFGADDGTATIFVSGGIAPYNYEWFDCATGLTTGQTTQMAIGLPPGSYQAVVTDDNGCVITGACQVIDEPAEITAIINSQFISCFGDCNGMLDVIPAGGTAPYFYQWQDEFGVAIPGQTNDTISNLCQGIYNLEITDINGCTQVFGPLDMTSPTNPWTVSVSQTNISCSGSCDGIAGVVVTAGNTPPYTYLWDDPTAQTTPTATNLCAGTYDVVISDATVCDTTITFTIIDASPILANADITNVLCFGDCTGEITANPSGGTGPYTISYSTGDLGPTASGLCAGAVTLTITDAIGCIKDTIINITEAPELTFTSSFSNNASCGLCNGSATVNVSGGVTPYAYDWTPDPTAGEGTNNATGLCSGIISVLITDANGCTETETFGISDVSAEDITVTSNDASCFGICDGDAEVTYICSDPVCVQEWYDASTGLSTGVTTSTITGLCAGDYFVEVINNSGCVAIEPVTISSPTEIIPNEVVTNIICNGDSNGSIELFPTGGSGAGYTYAWTPVPPNGDGTSEALTLTAGTWDVVVTDGTGCSQALSFTLDDPPAITITPSPTQVSCNGACDGSITISVSGGAGGFTFQWFNGGVLMPGETSTTVSGLCAGNYNVEVTDLNGCVVTMPADVTISEPVGLSTTATSTDVNCFGACDGTADVVISGGISPYSTDWFNAITGLPIGVSGESITGLCPGDYFAVVTDANGCSFTTITLTITEPTELTSALVTTDASCFGFCDGDAALNLAGGTLPYSYEWLDISGAPIPGGTDPNVINLCEGNYTVEGTDANGCSVGPIPFAINGFPEITGTVFTNDATCGVADGSATINPSGGNLPYTYQWYDAAMVPLAGETNNTLLGMFSGIYFVEVTDANGCTETFMGTISDLPATTVTFDALNHPNCAGGDDGSIEITATGVNPPLSFTWNPGGIIAEDPMGLEAGVYTLQITDALGCINYYDAELIDPPAIDISITTVPSDCGQCNGEAMSTVTGGTGVLNLVWNNGATTPDISGLCSGIYELTVTDENGCVATEQGEVLNTGGFTADIAITSITCAGSCDGEVTVTPVGGTPPYSIIWLHDGSTNLTITGLCSGSYYASVTDALGCIYAIEADVPDPNPMTATETIINPACGATDGSITVMTSGGILPHTYSWSSGGTSNAESGLGAGIYVLTVTDDAGCQETFNYGLNNSSAPVMELSSTDVSCFNACDGTADTLSVIGNNPAFTFEWFDDLGASLGVTTPAISGLCEGVFMLEVTDALGCQSYETVEITQPDSILLNPLFETDPTCNGVCDGAIVSNPIGGTPGYTFLWDDPLGQTTSTAIDLCDGIFTVTITDANGCVVNQTGTLTEPAAMTIVVDSTTSATCLNSADGEIFITVTGGNPTYTYEWVSQTLSDTLTDEDPTGLLPMNYYLTVTDMNGCIAQDTVSVDTLLVVLADAGLDSILCFKDSLIVSGSSNILTGANYTWYDSTGTVVLSDTNYLSMGNLNSGYTNLILMVDYLGCSHSDTLSILMGDSLWVDAGPDIDIYPDQTEMIGGLPTSSGEWSVGWTPGIYMDDTAFFNPSITDVEMSLWYYAIVTDTLGCSEIDSMYVTLLPDLEIPDGISPDGNGLNDMWILDFIDQYPGVDIKINVYNRWGDLLFESDQNYADDWGGTTADGKKLPAGTYYYVIDVDHEDFPEAVTGPITIMW